MRANHDRQQSDEKNLEEKRGAERGGERMSIGQCQECPEPGKEILNAYAPSKGGI